MRLRFLAPLLIILLLAGCTSTRDRVKSEQRSFSTLSYTETTKDKKTNNDLARRFDKQYVKWTARVKNITGDYIILRLDGLADIQAGFAYHADQEPVAKGEIATVSCKITQSSYIFSTWVLDECRVEATQESDKTALTDYESQLQAKQAAQQTPAPTAQPAAQAPDQPAEGWNRRSWTSNYSGLVGYVAVSSISDVSQYDKQFPSAPWVVHTVRQIGDHKFAKTDETVPHKTKVRVIEQNLVTTQPLGLYDGALLVETLAEPKQQFWLDHYNFLDTAYWQGPIEKAATIGPVIARYNGQGAKPHDMDGVWVDVPVGARVVAGELRETGTGFIKAKVFKQWKYGYGGVRVYFDRASLDVEY